MGPLTRGFATVLDFFFDGWEESVGSSDALRFLADFWTSAACERFRISAQVAGNKSMKLSMTRKQYRRTQMVKKTASKNRFGAVFAADHTNVRGG